jgi:hypothetical protein
MTTHDQHTEFDELNEHRGMAPGPRQADIGSPAPSGVPDESHTSASDTPTVAMKSVGGTQDEAESPNAEPLFGGDELAGLRAQWVSVQAEFVDNPKDCVEKADSLVSELIEKLTAGFADARSGLEQQWGQGETVSTEDLRVALRRYREFFERLLSV